MAKQRIKSRPGLFGTIYYYDEHGNPIGKSRPGLIEGTRVYTDKDGRYAGRSRQGFLAKEVFVDDNYDCITSYDGLLGEVHFKNGVPIGNTTQGFLDSEYTTVETEDDFYEEEYCEDILEEEWTEDQEEHDDTSYETDQETCEDCTPQVSRHTVAKNVQLFILCLVICMVIACIYAIVHSN